MSTYQLKIRESNKAAHIDIEKDIQERRNGLFTFTLRVNGGNIADYNVTEYVNAKERYLRLESIVITELAFTPDNRTTGAGDTLRTDHLYHGTDKRDCQD